MSVLRLGQLDIFVTAHEVLYEIFEEMNKSTTIPIVHNPGLNYEEAVEHYREQVDDRYKDQIGDGNTIVPTIIGWRRMPMKWMDGIGKKNAIQTMYCDQYDCNGDPTGDKVKWNAVKCDMTIQFRVYSSDVRIIDAIEVGFLTKSFISNIEQVDLFIPDRNTSESYQITWEFFDTEVEFTKVENQFITYDISCKVNGNMLTRPETVTGGSVSEGIGSDGMYKSIRNIAATHDFSTKFVSSSPTPNSSPTTNGSIYTVIAASDININIP
ncbi:hypothetical protein NVP1031O_175 [Vibrio phage 1.031.O._10N.261.46.F8]|nr:hypothetical protein NVP1031O_175 [Vibrio phage 1.031.O._10N.261.46.F8]